MAKGILQALSALCASMTSRAASTEHGAGEAGSRGLRPLARNSLAAAYDDAFEAVEAAQLALVAHLAETRRRNAQLDDAVAALAADYDAALAAMDAQLARDSARIEAVRAGAEAELQRLEAQCAAWRGGLEDALRTVQPMVEELPPALAVAERSRMVGLLNAAADARPATWGDSLDLPHVTSHVTPAWHFATLAVAAVAELGRRRGHVHVVGDPFSAHGAVWQARASRSRTELGEPSLALTVSCVEGPPAPAKRAFSVSAQVASLGVDVEYAGEWAQASEHVFSLCLLDAVVPGLDAEGGLTVRVGVRAESFRELALAQQTRIDVLEERVRALQSVADARPAANHDRRRSEARGWATSPRAPPVPLIPLPDPPISRRDSVLLLRRPAPIPFPISITPQRPQNVSQCSLAPTPLPISTTPQRPQNVSQCSLASSPPPASTHSQLSSSSSVLNDDRATSRVLRRLSGWVRTTTGRQSRTTTNQRPPAAPPLPTSDDNDADWTFLDRTLSPGFEQASLSTLPARRPLWPSRGLINVSPPPSIQKSFDIPDSAEHDLADDGFAFDGKADIERETARIDALRAERRRAQAAQDIEERCSSLAQRVNKIQLIANTCENSRDGFSEGALRRISSELGGRYQPRRNRRTADPTTTTTMLSVSSDLFSDPPGSSDEESSLCLSPLALRHPRRAVTMDSRDLGRAIERSVAVDDPYDIHTSPTPPPRYAAVSRKTSNSSVSSTSSSGGGGRSSAGRITRPGGGVACRQRRNSGSAGGGDSTMSPSVTPSKLGSSSTSGGAQLTPLANRQGGILKPGRTMRAKPVRLQALAEAITEPPPLPSQPWLDPPVLKAHGSPVVTRMTRSLSNATDDEAGGLGAPMPREPPLQPQRLATRLARPPRKSVRFPEEQRLLETIRLIDPRAAQTIENRVATSVYEPVAPPPKMALQPSSSSSSSDDESAPLSGLAARVRSSPRLAPRLLVEAQSSAVGPLLLDLGNSGVPLLHYERPPLPPPSQQHRGGRRRRRSGSGGRASNSSSTSSLLLHVGPNVASAQSSPTGPASGSVSSLSESSAEVLVVGATHSAHLYPTDLAAFGDAQIPIIACGRNTAFRASSSDHHTQGADLKHHAAF
ncbi:hypothetical protein GGI20_000508 [Coemansia sp. BCRC 34301]|nr:hypothetical protein GGI20_000508 [Coemansia sp. BCRC 34301]